MRTARISIARGAAAPVAAIGWPQEAPARTGRAAGPPPHPALVEHRLVALERLTRLAEQGALSPEEFAAEKALVLSLPADAPASAEPASRRAPSLLGRLLRWHFLPAGLAASLALAWWVQPHETMRMADQIFRTLGA